LIELNPNYYDIDELKYSTLENLITFSVFLLIISLCIFSIVKINKNMKEQYLLKKILIAILILVIFITVVWCCVYIAVAYL